MKRLYGFWIRFGNILGWINTRLLLTIIFSTIILPIGLFKRLFSKDAMARAYEPASPSYRISSDPIKPEAMEKPY